MLGRKVRHRDFGLGTVVGVEGIGDDRRVSVSFPGRGTKKFIERYAQLEEATARREGSGAGCGIGSGCGLVVVDRSLFGLLAC